MDSKTQHGYLVLADISGYTSFIAGTELEHAHEIISDLLETILGKFTPLLRLSKLEGDAVFCYANVERVPRGETLLELVEATYVAFRDRREAMHRRTTCTCRACQSIPTLDLKFMVHYGDFIRQDIAGIKELAGSAVNAIHRLLKNHVSESTGWRAYALFTDESLEHIQVRPADTFAQLETYEHLGEIQTFSFDLHARYEALVEARHIEVLPADADLVMVHDFKVPASVAWAWLNDPDKRNLCTEGKVTWSQAARPSGQTQAGARNHCAHGQGVSVETVLDWRPFNYVTAESSENGKRLVMETVRLEELPDGAGTRVYHYLRYFLPLPTFIRRVVFTIFMTYFTNYDQALNNAVRLSAQEWAAQERAAQPQELDPLQPVPAL